MKKESTIYLINPLAAKGSKWTPEVFQLIFGYRNSNYLNSLWLGTVWNLTTLPYRVFRELIAPVFNFRLIALFSLLVIPFSMLLILWHGIAGRLGAIEIEAHKRLASFVMSPQQCLEAIELGNLDVVTDVKKAIV